MVDISNKQIMVGIIGLGRSGRDIHGSTLCRHPKYNIVAVSDTFEERLLKAGQEWGCRTYRNHKALLKAEDVELVVVATPSHTHCSIAVEAFNHEKDVLIEKPIAASVKEVDEMIAVSKKSGHILTVFQNRRFDPDFLEIRRILSDGCLGPVQFIRRATYGFNRRNDWQALKKYGGGMLNNWGTHIIDQVLILMNYKVKEVFADVRLTVSAGDAEDHAKLTLKGENFPVDVEITSCCAYPQPEWLIMGKYGTLVGNASSLKYKYYNPKDIKPLPRNEDIASFSDYTYPSEEIPWQEEVIIEIKQNFARQNVKFYNALYDSIRNKRPLAVKPEQARMILEIIERVK